MEYSFAESGMLLLKVNMVQAVALAVITYFFRRLDQAARPGSGALQYPEPRDRRHALCGDPFGSRGSGHHARYL